MKAFASQFAGLAARALVAVALLVVLAPRPAGAQAGGDLSALQAALAELKAKVERLESERSQVKAPFTVVDEGGTAIFTVSKHQSGYARLSIGGEQGRAMLITRAEGADLVLAAGDRDVVYLNGSANTANLHIDDGVTDASIGTHSDGGSGVRVSRGRADANVSIIATERSGEIYLNGPSGPIFAVQNQDAPRMTLSNAAGQPLFGVGTFEGKPVMTLREEGRGRIQLGISTQGNAPYVSLFDATTERATIEGGATPAISLADAQGADVFNVTGANNPTMTLGRSDAARIALAAGGDAAYLSLFDATTARATIEGGATPAISLADAQGADVFNVTGANNPTMTLGRSDAARIALAGGGDAAYLSLFDTTVERIGLYGGTATRITLSDAQGEPILTGGGNPDVDKPVLTVGKPTGARVELGVTRDKAGSFTRWLDGTGSFRALAEGKTDGAVFSLRDSDGAEFFNAGMVTNYPPELSIGKADQPHVILGVTGDDTFASFYGKSPVPAASINAGNARTMLELRDKNMFARVGTVDETNSRLGLYVGKGDKTYLRANIGSGGEGGGEFAGSNDTGKPVAALIAGDDGGSLLVMGPQGGVAVAQVRGTNRGGEAAVFAPSGDRRGGLESSETGEGVFSVMGSGGSVAMTSGQTAPRLVIEKEGRQFVYLGATTDGEGVVKAGPGGNGVAGTLGSGLTAASSLQGKTQ